LAIFPRFEDARRLARAAADLHSQHDLDGPLLSPGRLHITLHAIAGLSDNMPQAVVDAAIAASSRVVSPSLPIVFDHVLSFTDSNAFVLRCNPAAMQPSRDCANRWHWLCSEQVFTPKPSDTPHMTMLYDPRHISQHAIELICWTATGFALILSHVGIHHHQWISRWGLADPH
jgi:RNA 2',3'-cyclic 3'-phosphodiesterase